MSSVKGHKPTSDGSHLSRPDIKAKREAALKKARAEGKVGHPQTVEIDWEQFEKLCALQCSQDEIAGFFHCSIDTIHDRAEEFYKKKYTDIFKEHSAPGLISLRREQFKSALDHRSQVMQIWLGKQYLGQTDMARPAGNHDEDTVDYDIREKLYD